MKDEPLKTKEIPFSGRLITSEDPAVIGPNFQELVNMRYSSTTPKGIGGHTKINTTPLTNPKVRAGIHFKKADESHVVVEAFNSGLTSSKIYHNTTAIPSTGDFVATEIYTPLSGTGRFSTAPNGYIAYANGAETCIYGGDETDVGGFINYDPDGSFNKDQTDQVVDTITSGDGHVATLSRVTNSTTDDVLLLHLENNATDSSPSVHTVSSPNITYSSGAKKWGSYGAVLNGTNAYFTVPSHADFNFSGAGATWTVDFWGTIDTLTNPAPIYYKGTDASNYFLIEVTVAGEVHVSHYDTGAETLNTATGFYTAPGTITTGVQYHIEIDRNGGDWYIFVDGILKGLLVDATDIGTETGIVKIGTDGTYFYDGNIDEYRVSSIATHADSFEIPSDAYGDGYTTYLYVGFILPVSQIKHYLSTVNTTASTASCEYWDGSGFAPVSTFVDNTSAGGISMAQTGAMTFDTTAATARLKEIKGLVLYWYRIKIDEADDNISVYHVSGSVPFQPIKELWDGISIPGFSFLKYTTKYEDYTTAVFGSDYIASSAETYFDMAGLTAAQSVVIGFPERLLGLRFSLVGGYVNTTANTIATVKYWDGAGWVSVGQISDNTSVGGISFNQAGLITWGTLSEGVEFKTEFTGALEVTPTLYYYQVSFSQTINVGRLDQVSGIPAQKQIGNYKFTAHAMNRLWLFSDQDGEKNKSICSAQDSTTVFNGEDSIALYWGDETEPMAAEWIYSQYGASVYSVLIVFKKNETWALIGNTPDVWLQYKISDSVGCVAPETVKVVEMPTDDTNGVSRSSIIIFQGANGIYMTDGRPPVLISQDINVFDKREALITNIDESFSFLDIENKEYHWCYSEATYGDKELVLSYGEKMQWFNITRPSPLQYGLKVETTDGATYSYGFIDNYMLRLEHGNSFDGTAITQTVRLGDVSLGSGLAVETDAEYHILITKAKSTAAQVTITHYGDSKTTGSLVDTVSLIKSGYRLVREPIHKHLGSHLFHSWKFSVSTSDEVTGFEPIVFICLFKQNRLYIKDYRP